MPVNTKLFHQPLIWSFWHFFAILATLWHFSQLSGYFFFIKTSSLEFLPYFSVDSGVEKNKGYERGHASHHQLVPPASNLVFLAFFAILATLWHYYQLFVYFLFINTSSLAILPYFSVDSGVEKNKGYERGHASHHQLVPPASKSHVILIFAQGRGPIFGVVVHKLP